MLDVVCICQKLATRGRPEAFSDKESKMDVFAEMTFGEWLMFFIVLAITIAIGVYIFMYLWNEAMVPAMTVLKPVKFWRAFGVMLFLGFYINRGTSTLV